jgi:uncharacterized protein DUF4190/zinc ribbon protein
MFCTRCGANNLDGDQFCRSCSSPLTKPGGAKGANVSSGSPQQSYPYATPGSGQQQQQPQAYTPQQPQYQGYSQAPYGYANQMYPPQAGASGRAIASMVLSIISVVTCGPFLSIPGMIMGKMEMSAIREGQSPQAGENFAKAGFYVGLVVTILSCLLGLGYMFLIFLGIASNSF